MKQTYLGLLALLILASCNLNKGDSEVESSELLEVPPSLVAFNIDFANEEFEAGVNTILPHKIWDGGVPMKNGKDSLFLKILRKGKLSTAIRQEDIYVSVPLQIEVAIKKKVLGMTMSNLDAPISFEGTLKASTHLTLQDDWDLDVSCLYRGFDLVGKPTFNILGLSFQIEKSIDKALEENRDQISDLMCKALDKAFDFKKLISNVYQKLQKGQRVAQNPENLWLYVNPQALSGKLIPKGNDTISLYVEFRSQIQITPDQKKGVVPVGLPKNGTPLNTKSTIVAYPEVKIGLDKIKTAVEKATSGREFSYESYTISIETVEVSRYENQIQVDLKAVGDINGVFTVRGLPSLDRKGMLSIRDFTYRVDAKEEWVGIAEWAIHDVIESYIIKELTLDASTRLGKLDSLIMAGIQKTPVSSKIGLDVDFNMIDSHSLRVTDDYLQWIFYVEGEASLALKRGLFGSR